MRIKPGLSFLFFPVRWVLQPGCILVISVLQIFIFDKLGIPFVVTAAGHFVADLVIHI